MLRQYTAGKVLMTPYQRLLRFTVPGQDVEGHVDVLRQRVVELVLIRDQDVLVIFGLLVGEYLPAALFFKIFDFKLQPAPVFVHMRIVVGMHQKFPFRQSCRKNIRSASNIIVPCRAGC